MTGKKPLAKLKWESYNLGSMRTSILEELNSLVQDKDYRQEKGLEYGSLREVKSNPHWQLHATIELFEMLLKQLDDTQKGTFFRTYQQLNSSNEKLVQLSTQVAKTESNLGTNMSKMHSILSKSLTEEAQNLKVIQKELNDSFAELNTQNEDLKNNIKKILKILKTALTSELNTISEKINTEMGQMKENIKSNGNMMREDIGSLKQYLQTESSRMEGEAGNYFGALTSTLDEKLNDFGSEITSITQKSEEKIDGLFSVQNTSLTNFIEDKITTHQETLNSKIEERQNAILTKLQESFEESNKQIIELKQNIKSESDDNTNNLMQRMNELNEGQIEKYNELKTSMENQLSEEIKDLRTVLTSIRADIELMKAVVTQLSK